MAVITPNLIDLILTNTGNTSVTGWAGTSDDIDIEVYKQATTIGTDGSYTYQTGKNTLATAVYTFGTNINMTANYTTPHLYWTMRCDVFPFCEALNTGATNSGLMLRVTDGTGNYVQWHLEGRDTWDGSWKNFVLDLTNTSNIHSTSGTLSLADVDQLTWYTDNSNSGTIRIIDNTWLDAIRYGEGLSVNSTTTEDINFQDIADDDALTANYYGVLQETDGVLFCQGELKIGADGQTTNFVSSGETVYFKDKLVSTDHYGITYVSGGASNTDIGLDALVCKTVGGTGAELNLKCPITNTEIIQNSTFIDMGAIVIDYMDVIGSRFVGCGTFLVKELEFDSVVFDTCGIHTFDGANVFYTNCVFDSCTGAYNILGTNFDNITDNTFISDGTGHAVSISSPLTGDLIVNWDNYSSGYASVDGTTGNETIYVNCLNMTSVTINVGAGYDVPTIYAVAGPTVTVVVNPVTTLITVKNQDGDPIEGARVYAVTESTVAFPSPPLSDGTVLFNTVTDVNGQVSDTRALASSQPITGWSRDSTAPAPYYKQTPYSEVIDNTVGLTLNVLLILDE